MVRVEDRVGSNGRGWIDGRVEDWIINSVEGRVWGTVKGKVEDKVEVRVEGRIKSMVRIVGWYRRQGGR